MTDSPAPSVPAKKKRSIGMLIFKLFGVLVLLVIVGLAAVYFFRNELVKAGVTRGGEHATGQKTGLLAADLSIGSGTLNLSQLDIANLKDYKEPKLLTMKECNVQVQTGSLLTHTVTIDLIEITGLELTLETNSNFKNNLADLIELLKKNSPAADPSPASAAQAGPSGSSPSATPPESPGKVLKIVKLRVASPKVHLRGLVNMDLDLGPIEMDDPMNPDGRPMKIADVMTKILLHLSQQIVENPQIPGNIKDSMKNVQALVNSLGKDLQKDLGKNLKGLQDLGKNLPDIGKNLPNVGKNLQDMGKNLPDAGKNLQDAGKGLQNLLGGNKPATQPK